MKFLELQGQFQIFKTWLLYFPLLSLLVKERDPPSFEQSWIPFTQECFVPIWLKLTQSMWWRRLAVDQISKFLNYPPWKEAWPYIWTELVIHVLPMDTLCQVWLKLARWFRRIRWKCENLQTERWRTDGTGDLKTHLSFQLSWAKK